MHKKSQITLFIILGISLVLVFLFVFIFANNIKEVKTGQAFQAILTTSKEVTEIRSFLNSCLEDSTTSILNRIGNQGGVLFEDHPHPRVIRDSLTVPYFLFQNTLYLPTQKEIHDKIKTSLPVEFHKCISNNNFDDIGIILIIPPANDMDTQVIINDNNVFVEIQTMIEIQKDLYSTTLNDFTFTTSIPLGTMMKKSIELIKFIQAVNTDPSNPAAFNLSTMNFSPLKACFVQDKDKFIRFHQKNSSYAFIFALDGQVVGPCSIEE